MYMFRSTQLTRSLSSPMGAALCSSKLARVWGDLVPTHPLLSLWAKKDKQHTNTKKTHTTGRKTPYNTTVVAKKDKQHTNTKKTHTTGRKTPYNTTVVALGKATGAVGNRLEW